MKKYTLFLIAVAFILSMVNIVHVNAQEKPGVGVVNSGTAPQSIPSLQNPLKAKNVTDVLLSIVDLAIFLGVILAVFMFIFIGFKFILAQGNSAKLAEARSWFLYAAIGTAVLISSKVIVEVIKSTFISAGVVDSKLFDRKI